MMTAIVPARAPGLKWQALVDWTGQGIWGAQDADVTDDLVSIEWGWGRRGRPAPEFAAPASLSLTLRNPEGRYTPGNAGSPLSGLVTPGKEVWLRAAWPSDDFTTAGGAAQGLDGRAASDGGAGAGGAVWRELAAAGNGFQAQAGVVRGVAGRGRPADAAALLDTGDPLASLLVRFRRVGNRVGGFVLRGAARDDCLRLRFADGESVLERVSGRRATRLAAGAALAAGVWHELEIQQSATSVRVFATNLAAAGTVRREIIAATGIAGAPDSGRHGLWHAFRNTVDRWGEFGVGRSLFVGRIRAVEPDYAGGRCRIVAADFTQALDGVRLHRKLAGGVTRSGAVGAAILGWAGLLPGEYALDVGRVLRSGAPRSVWDTSAGRALRQLQREENGLIYADGLGRIRMEAAAARESVRGQANPGAGARVTLALASGGSGAYVGGVTRDDGAGAVEREVTFRYQRAVDNGAQLIWNLNEPLAIGAAGSRLVVAANADWDVITDVATPVANTDYRATADAAGTGADVTAAVAIAVVPEAESKLAGRGVVLRVSNRGAQTAYLQRLAVRAAHCWRPSGATAYRRAADDGIAAEGISRDVDCRFIDHYAAAQQAADARFAEYARRRPQLELSLPLATAANLRAAIEGRLSDVVAVPAGAPGVSGAWFLEGMELRDGGAGLAAARWWVTGV